MFPEGLNADSKQIAECLQRYGVERNNYILFVGTLSPRKNDVVMLKAYFEYRKRGGTKKLLLAGNIAKKSEHVKKMIRESEYSSDVILAGYITDIEKRIFYYYGAMLLFPSRLEGFGFPLLEAMQARIPVITSRVSCMPEIAGDAAIYLNDIDNWSELADCIFRVESLNEKQKSNLIELGLTRVEFFENQDFRPLTYNAIREMYKDKI